MWMFTLSIFYCQKKILNRAEILRHAIDFHMENSIVYYSQFLTLCDTEITSFRFEIESDTIDKESNR